MSARNGTFGRVPRLVRDTALFGGKYLYFDSVAQALGSTQNRNTAGSYAKQTGRLYVYYPLIVSSLDWDVRIADEYICRFVTSTTSTTSVFDVNASVVVGAPGTVTITPTNGDFLLIPGVYYLQLATHDGATVLWWDKSGTWISYTYFIGINITYTSSDAYNIPVRLTVRPGNYTNLATYSR